MTDICQEGMSYSCKSSTFFNEYQPSHRTHIQAAYVQKPRMPTLV